MIEREWAWLWRLLHHIGNAFGRADGAKTPGCMIFSPTSFYQIALFAMMFGGGKTLQTYDVVRVSKAPKTLMAGVFSLM